MSLCYDFQKWTILTLGLVGISLTVGLVLMHVVHGQTDNVTERGIIEANKLIAAADKANVTEQGQALTVNNSDFYLEAYAMDIETNNTFLNTMNPNELNITKFELRGDAGWRKGAQ